MTPLQVYAISGITPVVDPSAFVHPSAVLIGDVIVGAGCYVGPCASLRGDMGRIQLHAGSNVQDCCILHGFPGADTVVEEEGHVGHGAVLHSCIVRRGALIGMKAVVHDQAIVGEYSIVGACAFVKAGMEIPPRSLVAGVPARVIRAVTEQEIAWKASGTRSYQELAVRSLQTMQRAEPLAAPEPDRRRITLDELLPLSEFKQRS